MGDLTLYDSSSSPAVASRTPPVREDCWSEDATATLVEAWGRRYLDLNRGNLRQKDWQEVADAVNSQHGHSFRTRRTDVQCKNRIDTLKKKYKVEKSRVSDSNGVVTSSWTFFNKLDYLIGPGKKLTSPSVVSPNVNNVNVVATSAGAGASSPPMGVPLPVQYRRPVVPHQQQQSPVLPQKRQFPSPASAADESYFRRNYSAVAAAAAAAAVEEDDEEETDEEGEDDIRTSESEGRGGEKRDGAEVEVDGMRRLARAIERFGEMYERVEAEKQKQMIELEKQRMQFTKDLEVQRMQLFMDTQVQLEKMKQAKRSRSDDIYS